MKITQDKTTHPDMTEWNCSLAPEIGCTLTAEQMKKAVLHLKKHEIPMPESVIVPLSAIKHFSRFYGG